MQILSLEDQPKIGHISLYSDLYYLNHSSYGIPKRGPNSVFLLKIIKILAKTTKEDGHISGTAGPNLLIFGQIGANIVNSDPLWDQELGVSLK